MYDKVSGADPDYAGPIWLIQEEGLWGEIQNTHTESA